MAVRIHGRDDERAGLEAGDFVRGRPANLQDHVGAKRVFRRKTSVAKPLPVLVRGTNFQVRVWRALLSVPAGRTVSYSELARMSGYPRAVRAVGSAMGANRIAYLIPCHRVVRSDGQLGQYAWGTARKAAALAFDASLQ